MNNFQIVEVPLALPGTCMACGSTPDNRKWFLDLDRDEEGYGALYLCNICIGSLVDLCGFGSAAKLAGLEARIGELQDENFQLNLELDGLRKVRDGLSDLGLAISPDIGSGGDLVSVGAPVQSDAAAETGSLGAGSQLDSRARADDESSDESNVGPVRSGEQLDAIKPFSLEL